MPAYQLACQAGAKLDYDDDSAAFTLSGLPAGLFLAGSVNSIHWLDAVLVDGRNAARAALRCIDMTADEDVSAACAAQVNHPWPIFPHP